MGQRNRKFQLSKAKRGGRATHLSNERELLGRVVRIERVHASVISPPRLVLVLLVAVRGILLLRLDLGGLLGLLCLGDAELVLRGFHAPARLGLLEVVEDPLGNLLALGGVEVEQDWEAKGKSSEILLREGQRVERDALAGSEPCTLRSARSGRNMERKSSSVPSSMACCVPSMALRRGASNVSTTFLNGDSASCAPGAFIQLTRTVFKSFS